MAAQDARSGIDRTTTVDGERDHERAKAGFDPRPLIALLGLGGFAILTWIIVSGTTLAFDQGLLDAAKGLGQYMPEWKGLSDSANLPLIAVGAGIVGWLLWTKQ